MLDKLDNERATPPPAVAPAQSWLDTPWFASPAPEFGEAAHPWLEGLSAAANISALGMTVIAVVAFAVTPETGGLSALVGEGSSTAAKSLSIIGGVADGADMVLTGQVTARRVVGLGIGLATIGVAPALRKAVSVAKLDGPAGDLSLSIADAAYSIPLGILSLLGPK